MMSSVTYEDKDKKSAWKTFLATKVNDGTDIDKKNATEILKCSTYAINQRNCLNTCLITSPRLIIPTKTPLRSTGTFLIFFSPKIAAISSIGVSH
jgi:hypothetical protein